MAVDGFPGVNPAPQVLRIPYKIFPITRPSAAAPGLKSSWVPVLSVSLVVNHRPTRRFEAIIDSGSQTCLFHGDIAKAYGLKLDSVEPEPLGGVIGGAKGWVFYHDVKLSVPGGGSPIKIVAGFSPQLSVAGLLGRSGFFENFRVTFDSCAEPPSVIIERFYRA